MKQLDFLPKFAFKATSGTWIRMDEESPMPNKETALKRKKELGDFYSPTNYRIMKHGNKYFLYEKKT